MATHANSYSFFKSDTRIHFVLLFPILLHGDAHRSSFISELQAQADSFFEPLLGLLSKPRSFSSFDRRLPNRSSYFLLNRSSYFLLNVVRSSFHRPTADSSFYGDTRQSLMVLCHPVPWSLFRGLFSFKCWIKRAVCDETVQFNRNYKHCSAASYCCCRF